MRNHLAPAALVAAVFAAPVLWAGCSGGSDPAGCTPVTESCNGIDDDCDGETDEAGAAGCTTFFEDADSDGSGGASACLCAAAAPFTLTQGGDCDDANASIRPGAAEGCNGVDDDCDAQTDEGLAGCCTPDATQPCGVAQGSCAAGTATCDASFAWGPCLDAGGAPVVLPGDLAESCNGVDDDCDGETDEPGTADCTSYWADADADGFGAGSPVCTCAPSGLFTATVPDDCDDLDAGTHPGAVEACNGVDDDCDGQTDEGFGLGGSCTAGTGACAATGVTICTPDGSGTACDAIPGQPGTELCNGVDDDCDGQTDEETADAGAACDGPDADLCNEGTIACAGGNLACTDATSDSVELCNGLDDDCDGQTDEGFGLGASCTVGTGACAAAGQTVCRVDGTGVACDAVPGQPGTEVCNGVDDDCDGQTDEATVDAGAACDGPDADLCNEGTIVCAGGSLACSDATPDSVELCNGIDDDCDGATDESLTPLLCPNQMGVCAGSRATCFGASGWLCTPASYGASYEPDETLCDNLDNDCDGTTDDPYGPGGTVRFTDLDGITTGWKGSSCGLGRCAGGVVVCSASKISLACSTWSNAITEVCANAVDDDCDGQTDEAGCL